jgi:hypothetical protein
MLLRLIPCWHAYMSIGRQDDLTAYKNVWPPLVARCNLIMMQFTATLRDLLAGSMDVGNKPVVA